MEENGGPHMSEEYFKAAINMLLQTNAEIAAKAAGLAGQLADAKAAIEQQQAKIEELQKPSNVEPIKAKT